MPDLSSPPPQPYIPPAWVKASGDALGVYCWESKTWVYLNDSAIALLTQGGSSEQLADSPHFIHSLEIPEQYGRKAVDGENPAFSWRYAFPGSSQLIPLHLSLYRCPPYDKPHLMVRMIRQEENSEDASKPIGKEQEGTESHQILQSLIDGMPDAIALLDQTGIIRYTNQAWHQHAQKGELPAWMGSKLGEVFWTERTEEVQSMASSGFFQSIQQILRGERRELSHEYQAKLAGKEGWFRAQILGIQGGSQLKLIVRHEDITTQKQMYLSLEESEATYRTMAEHFPNGMIALFNHDLRYTLARGKGLAAVGLSPEMLEGKRLEDFMPPDIAERDRPALIQALSGVASSNVVSFGEQYFAVQTLPVTDSHGNIVSGMVMSQNVSELKEQELKLRLAMEELELAIHTAGLGIWKFQIDSGKLDWNDTLLRMYGYSREQFEAHPHAWRNMIVPEDLPGIDQTLAAALNGQTIYQSSFRILLDPETEKIRYINASAAPVFNEEGNMEQLIGVNTDVTPYIEQQQGLEEREAHLKAISERFEMATLAAEIGIWELFPETQELIWSEAVYHLYDYPPDMGKVSFPDWAARLHPDDQDQALAWFQGILQEGEDFSQEYRIVWPSDGSIHLLRTVGRIERDEAGNAIRMIGVNWDITQEREAEDQRILAETLSARNEELEQFAFAASHDLKEPIRTIAGFASLIKRRKESQLDAETLEFLSFIQDGAKRMGYLVQELLAYSRIGTNRQLQEVDCQALVGTLLQDLAHQIEGAGASIQVDPLPRIQAYGTEIRVLFQNLVSNAIKFRPADRTPTIVISATEQANGWLFSVQDNGIGIEEKYHQHIFTIFKRLHGTDHYEGTGIGLAHCAKIVELHNGKIWVESTPGEGSTFYFSLPQAGWKP